MVIRRLCELSKGFDRESSRLTKWIRALLGFLLSLSPLSCDLMGWRGAGGNGAAGTSVFSVSYLKSPADNLASGAYFFMGGVLMIIGGVLEFFLGNTFPFVVFSSFGQSFNNTQSCLMCRI